MLARAKLKTQNSTLKASPHPPSPGNVMAKRKTRLDQLLVQRGLVETRAKAQALILAGEVQVNGVRRTKPGEQVAEDVDLAVASALPYVSRGGYKLAHALDTFGLSPAGRVALDVGA